MKNKSEKDDFVRTYTFSGNSRFVTFLKYVVNIIVIFGASKMESQIPC